MNGNHERLAWMHQEDLLEEARHARLVREALGRKPRGETSRRALALAGAILIRIGERLRAGCAEDPRRSSTAQRPMGGSSTATLCHGKK
jgi:hypothetical protein